MILNSTQKQKIIDYTLEAYPNEMCGVCTQDDFIQLKNASENPLTSFSFDPVEYAAVVSQVTAIVHSHTKDIYKLDIFDLRTPSPKDWHSQRTSGKPWLIVGTEGQNVSEPIQLPRTPSAEYLGRPFIWYVNDCYTLVQDYYRFEFGIILPPHPHKFDWTAGGLFEDMVDDYVAEIGLERVPVDRERVNGDIVVLSRMGMSNNHLGIFHDGKILHQDEVSVEVPAYAFANRISQVLRYAH